MSSDIVIPDSPRDLGIPKDSWREGQREAVLAVLDAFLGGAKYVMLSAPTGAGKSVIAAAVQKMLARAGGSGEGRSIALTHTIQLQNQYIETLPDAAVITGRGNYDCELPDDHIARLGFPRLSAEDAPCSSGDGCDSHLNRRGGCDYYSQFWEAADAPMVTMNYAYAARIMGQEWFSTGERDPISLKKVVVRNPFRRSLLVADECHLAERAIVEAAGVKLNVRLLRDLDISLPHPATRQRILEGRTYKEYETTGVWAAWAAKAIAVVEEGIEHTESRAEYLVAKKDERSMEELAIVRFKGKRLNALLEGLRTLSGIEALRYDEWSIKRETSFDGKTVLNIVAQPLWGWTVAQESLWQWFDKVLLMSATPGDPAIERIKLGIPESQFVFIERASVFPVKNRPVYFWPVAKLSYSSTDADWQQIARAISQIANSGQWAERKGLIHSGSKANAAKLVTLLNNLNPGPVRFVTHGSKRGDAAAALEAYKRSPEPLVLVTASFTTGLDLPYLIGWQVIAKVPFGSLADEMTARRRAFKDANGVDFGQRVYQSEAMNTVVQAAGRIVRAQDDTGPTFIVDANYAMLHRMAWAPAFYREAYQQLSMAD